MVPRMPSGRQRDLLRSIQAPSFQAGSKQGSSWLSSRLVVPFLQASKLRRERCQGKGKAPLDAGFGAFGDGVLPQNGQRRSEAAG